VIEPLLRDNGLSNQFKEHPFRMKLKLPAGSFRAYLFDCDGTIVDSMPLHYIAWKKALAEWNCVYEEKLFYSWGGRPVREILTRLNQMQDLQAGPGCLSAGGRAAGCGAQGLPGL